MLHIHLIRDTQGVRCPAVGWYCEQGYAIGHLSRFLCVFGWTPNSSRSKLVPIYNITAIKSGDIRLHSV